MAAQTLTDISYTDLFAALGKFITEKQMRNVCVMEFEDGVIVNGSVIHEGRTAIRRDQETFILTVQELARMAAENRSASPKRGLFG